MRFPFVLAVLVVGVSQVPGVTPRQIKIFNGKDLDGWTPKITGHTAGENWGDTFTAKDGVLSVRYGAYTDFGGKFGHLFYKTAFSSYILRLEYRFVGKQVPGGPGWAY